MLLTLASLMLPLTASSVTPFAGASIQRTLEDPVLPEVSEDDGPACVRFSASPILDTSTSGFRSTFGGQDRLYARFQLPHPLRHYVGQPGLVRRPVKLLLMAAQRDGTLHTRECVRLVAETELDARHLDVELLPEPSQARFENDPDLSWVLTQCTPGPLHLRLQAKADCGDFASLGYGDCTLNWSPARHQVLEKDRAEAKQVAQRHATANRSLPKDFQDRGSFRDAALSSERIQCLVQRDLKQVATILKLAIREGGGADWDVQKDGGLPKFMLNSRPIFLAWKGKDGQAYYGRVDIRRNYLGGGRYSDPFAELGDGIQTFNGKLP